MSLERVPEGERRGEDAQRQVGEGQRRDERVARVDPQLPAIEIQCLCKFSITLTYVPDIVLKGCVITRDSLGW